MATSPVYLATRDAVGLPFSDRLINSTLTKLKAANSPPTQLLHFWPKFSADWDYDDAQWNATLTMSCSFNRSAEIADPVSTGNCTNGAASLFPQAKDLYWY